ncbi:MAG: ParB/RepB/Spo0J family partition protein [Chloracidobacterium sp.]
MSVPGQLSKSKYRLQREIISLLGGEPLSDELVTQRPEDVKQASPEAASPETNSDKEKVFQYGYIKLNECMPNEWQVRRPGWDEPSQLTELRESLSTQGQITPIVVARTNGTAPPNYRIICGHRRVAAMRLLGWKQVEAKIYTNVSRENELIEIIAENVVRRRCTSLEMALAVGSLFNMGISQEKIAAAVGCSQTMVSRYAQLAALTPATREQAFQNRLTLLQTLQFGRLTTDAERQQFLLECQRRRQMTRQRFVQNGLEVVIGRPLDYDNQAFAAEIVAVARKIIAEYESKAQEEKKT